ncbi:MAG: heme o synthase [Frankiales bacterium]|nr:heme o synthase [Frankiales bacterium]
MTTVASRPAVLDAPAPRRPVGALIRAYVALTKPRIIELLLVTTLPVMVLAARGLPSVSLMVWTLVGGSFAAGSANALNCYFDRDIDVLMRRTSRRPLATASVRPGEAMVFGLALGALAVVTLWLGTNGLSALLGLAAIVFYVVGYTLLLKRHTSQNIVWGGAAGCMPVLIGWSAVSDSLGWAPLVLFGVVFLWTPPHFWALAVRFRDDYAAAGVPMLPVVASDVVVARRILYYSWAMVGCSLALIPVAPTGAVYAVAAVVLGGAFLVEAHRLDRAARRGDGAGLKPMRLFHFSISYLTLLFVAVAVDALLQ